MISGILTALFAAYGIGAPVSVPVEQPTGTAESEIVVTGRRLPRETLIEFVDSATHQASDDGIAVWQTPVCPSVVGLSEDHNSYIAGVVVAVASAVGAPVADDDCQRNVIAIFTDDPGALVRTLREERVRIFDALSSTERERLTDGTDSVRGWSVLDRRTADGRTIERVSQNCYNAWDKYGARKNLCFSETESANRVGTSRVIRPVRLELAANYIIIDRRRIVGMTLQQLSGYVAMAALGQFDLTEHVNPSSSILNLFHADGPRPDDLSPVDIAFLRGLYAASARQGAQAQRRRIVDHMLESLGEPVN